MRVCFIGNSHLAVVSLAWRAMPESQTSGLPSTFFGAVGSRFATLNNTHGVLTSDKQGVIEMMKITSGGLAEIRTEEYEVFVLIGLGFGFAAAAALYRFGSIWGKPPGATTKHLLSRNCLEQALNDGLRSSVALEVARKIHQTAAKPVLLVPEPYPSASILAHKSFNNLALLRDAEKLEELETLYLQAGQTACKEADVELLLQNRETIEFPGFTKAHYIQGAQKGDVKLPGDEATLHNEENYRHMNTDYGKIVVTGIIGKLREYDHSRLH